MDKVALILENVKKIIIGKEEVTSKLLAGILCGGHILIEDVPGVGKTTLVDALARTLGCTFSRIQFTPDLMPADIIGISVFDRQTEQFTYRPGPIMKQVILADEINRTSPRTQASLLEAMAEGQVSVDGTTHALPRPFIVLATQNPIEYEGTYPLPEAQLDRFMMRVSIGYPSFGDEREIVKIPAGKGSLQEMESVVTPEELLAMQKQTTEVFMASTLESYIVDLTQATRAHRDVLLGVSPRGGQHLYRGAKGLAFIRNRDYVIPDDIKAMLTPVFSHRLILKPDALLKGRTAEDIIAEILSNTPVPVIPNVNR
jgi:MoxR-like ATPase